MTHDAQRSEVQEAKESSMRAQEAAQAADKLREGLFALMDEKEIAAKQIVWGQLSDKEIADRNIRTRDAKLEGAEGQKRDFPGGVSTFRRPDGEFTLVLPPGAKYTEDKDGNVTATDAKGKPLAEQRADGTMIVHTDTGSYVETSDGKVTFLPKFKSEKPAQDKEKLSARARKAQGAAKRAELRAKGAAKRAELHARAAASPTPHKIDVGNLDDPIGGLEEDPGSLEDLSQF